MTLKFTILGCGNSTGVPFANGGWGGCDPSNPRNRRRRSSVLFERNGTRVLIDAGPDLREQMISHGVDRLDAVIFTHAHADHTAGIDDLRVFGLFGGHPLAVYGFPEVLEQIHDRFRYMFGGGRAGYYDKPFLTPHPIEAIDLTIGALQFRLFEQDHTVCRSMGIRVGPVAYSTDVKQLPPDARLALGGLDTWVVAAVRREPHIAHAHLEQVLAWIDELEPRQAYLTHMNNCLDYMKITDEIPSNVTPAYDGLVLEFDD